MSAQTDLTQWHDDPPRSVPADGSDDTERQDDRVIETEQSCSECDRAAYMDGLCHRHWRQHHREVSA